MIAHNVSSPNNIAKSTGNKPALLKRMYKLITPTYFWAQIMLVTTILHTVVSISFQLYTTIIRSSPSPENINKPLKQTFSRTEQIHTISMNKQQFITTELVYHLIFMIAQLFSLLLIWDSLLHKNIIQVIAFLLFNVCLLVYSVIQYKVYHQPIYTVINNTASFIDLLIIVIYSLCCITYFLLFYELYKEFGWKVYKKLGANKKISKIYKAHLILITLIKMEAFFFIGYSIQLVTLTNYTKEKTKQYIDLAVILPFCLAVIVPSYYALLKEKKKVLLFVFFSHVVIIFYLLYQLYDIYRVVEGINDNYIDTRYYLTFFVAVMLILVGFAAYFILYCYRNCNKGLKKQILNYQLEKKMFKGGCNNRISRFELDME